MTYCEGCKWFHQHYWEDKAHCRKTKQPTEATDEACGEYEAPEGQTRLEV